MTLPFNIPPFLVESYAIPIEDSRKFGSLDREKFPSPIFAHFGEPFGEWISTCYYFGTDHDFVVVKINNIESEDNIMKTFYECKTEEERQELRDSMLETIYYQTIATRNEVSEIRAKVRKIEQKLVYVGATPEERKYINVDGTLKLDAINETCDNILKLFGDKYVSEVIEDGKDEGKNTITEVD